MIVNGQVYSYCSLTLGQDNAFATGGLIRCLARPLREHVKKLVFLAGNSAKGGLGSDPRQLKKLFVFIKKQDVLK